MPIIKVISRVYDTQCVSLRSLLWKYRSNAKDSIVCLKTSVAYTSTVSWLLGRTLRFIRLIAAIYYFGCTRVGKIKIYRSHFPF